MNFEPISGLARELLNMKRFDRATAGAGGAGVAGAATAAAPPVNPRAGLGLGGGGGNTAVPLQEDPASRAHKDDLADQMFQRGKYSQDGANAAMMADAGRKNKAFQDRANKDYAAAALEAEYQKSQGIGGSRQSSNPSIGDQIQSSISPSGANGEKIATDQNGGTSSSSRSGGALSGIQPKGEGYDYADLEAKRKEESQGESQEGSQGYDTANNESGGEPRASGGPVRAGGLYRVAEGNRPELYVQNDGDAYPLTRETSMRPREGGVIVPSPEVAKLLNKPAHYRSLDEQAALAPVLDRIRANQDAVEARTREAEGKRFEALAAKNPYRARLEQMDKNPTDDGLKDINLKSLSPGEAGFVVRQMAGQRAGRRAQIQGMADAVDAANDPYNKVLDAQRQRLEAQQGREAQRQQREQDKTEAAARGITSMHGSEGGREQIISLGGPDALKAAEDVARANVARTIKRAGGAAPDLMNESDENLRKIRAGMAAGS